MTEKSISHSNKLQEYNMTEKDLIQYIKKNKDKCYCGCGTKINIGDRVVSRVKTGTNKTVLYLKEHAELKNII